jgi:hypothetical protein
MATPLGRLFPHLCRYLAAIHQPIGHRLIGLGRGGSSRRESGNGQQGTSAPRTFRIQAALVGRAEQGGITARRLQVLDAAVPIFRWQAGR